MGQVQQPGPFPSPETPPVVEQPPPQMPQQRRPPPPPEPEPVEEDNEVRYIRGHKPSKGPRVYSRWALGGPGEEPGLRGFRRMVRSSRHPRLVTITVKGVLVDPYTGKRGQTDWKSFVIPRAELEKNIALSKTSRTAINRSIEGIEWEEVEEIQVLDR